MTEETQKKIPAAETTLSKPATIATLAQHEGEVVTLHGWLYNMRASGKLLFPDLPRWHGHDAGDRAEGGGERRRSSRR